ncbi:MAG: hypothetical protein Q9166_006181 [cf. Caloplaca sp. 2 TL-2023]
MHIIPFNRYVVLVTLISFLSSSFAAVLPSVNYNVANDVGTLTGRGSETASLDTRANNVTDPGFSLTARPHFQDPYIYHIPPQPKWPRGGKSIIFSQWDTELPNFDDVISVLDKAETELEREIKNKGWDPGAIEPRRGWNDRTAHLVVVNAQGIVGMDHHELLVYLDGLRQFGFQYGFWTAQMEFYDSTYAIDTRGRGYLEWARPPREGVAAEA